MCLEITLVKRKKRWMMLMEVEVLTDEFACCGAEEQH